MTEEPSTLQEQQHSANNSSDANAAVSQQSVATVTTQQQPQHYLSSQINSRLDRTTVCLPIVHGSVAFYLGKRAENKNEYQSHQWTLYLRGLNNEDLSICVEKVVFQLHPSFAQPIREFKHPPFEVTEKGWGEFEAQIRIYWKDPSEQMTMLTHGIKLYPPGTPANVIPTNTDVPVVSEVYDEIVFTNPKESFFLDVLAISDTPSIEQEYSQSQHFTKISDTADMQALLEAQKFIQQQLLVTKERFLRLNEELDAIDVDIDNAVMPPAPPPPPNPPATQQPSLGGGSQPMASATQPAPSKPRTNTGGATKPRNSAKTTTKGTGGTKQKSSIQQQQQPQPTTGGATAPVEGSNGSRKKAKTTRKETKSNDVSIAIAPVVSTVPSSTIAVAVPAANN